MKKNILPFGGKALYYPSFFNDLEADSYFQQLKEELNWEQKEISSWGKSLKLPRLTAWHGEKDCVYYYSKIRNEPSPWTKALIQIKEKLKSEFDLDFNGVLANFYHNGMSSISYHRDREKALNKDFPIISISFGQTRKMLFKHVNGKMKNPVPVILNSGDLLIQDSESQNHWLHGIPKDPKQKGERINLTFRQIYPFKVKEFQQTFT